MRLRGSLIAISVLAVFLAVLACGCTTFPAPAVQRTAYCSPFTASGDLTPWAEEAVREGIGLRVVPNGTPHPGNRVGAKRNHTHVTVGDRRSAEEAARRLGGWDAIEAASSITYPDAEQLWLAVSGDHRDHARYADVMAAAMVLYPELKAYFYRVRSGAY